MKPALFLLASAAAVAAAAVSPRAVLNSEWELFKAKHGGYYYTTTTSVVAWEVYCTQ